MKLLSFIQQLNSRETMGLFYQDRVYPLATLAQELNLDISEAMLGFLQGGPRQMDAARKVEGRISKGDFFEKGIEAGKVQFLAPIPQPPTLRDGYAFRQHVEASRRNRGLPMIPEFDEFPVFYFGNPHAIVGPGEVGIERDHLERLDFELEVAAVIGKKGRNIRSSEADAYIAGLTIMNDFSARRLQMDEMKLSLGPAKGKDFATSLGPWLVTLDELEPYSIPTPHGTKHRLSMTAHHNGNQVSEGNLAEMNWTFAQLIERISYGVDIFPGDVIGSGTVGTGCYLELNGTGSLKAKTKGETYHPTWLQAGDKITLMVKGLGSLENTIGVPSNNNGYSLFS